MNPIHNITHAREAIANNPGISLESLLNNQYKNWDDEAKAYFNGLITPAAKPETTQRQPEGFRAIALRALARGERRILPIKIGGKNPAIKWAATPDNIRDGVDTRIDTFTTEEWGAVASQWIDNLASRFPDLNACVIAKPNEFVFIDCDTYHEFVAGYEAFAVETFPVTYTTSARDNRTQIHFRQTDATRALGNVIQFKSGDVELSIRQKNEYVLAEGSQHPDGSIYQRLVDAPIVSMPDKLVEYIRQLRLASLKKDSTSTTAPADGGWVSAESKLAAIPRNSSGKMVHGSYHGAMLTVAGYWRAKGLDAGAIEDKLVAYAEENFEHPIDWAKVKTMSVSICGFPAGTSIALTLPKPTQTAAQQPDATTVAPKLHTAPHPEFPSWVMENTSLFEGFVKPYCAVNSRIPYFMWYPSVVLFLNYLGTKVYVKMRAWQPSMYLVLIGEKDRAHKSSSITDALNYFELASALSMYSENIKNADGRTVVMSGGSPEGIGKDMMRTNTKNVCLYYDELSTMVSKSQIEGSGIMGALLTMYESGTFTNSVKSKKDSYSIPPKSYVASLITSTTDQRFHELWGQFAGDDTGLNTRFTFILQPQQLPEEELEEVVPFHEAALKTRTLIDKAVNQREFDFDYGFDGKEMLKECQKTCGGRAQIRAEKLALYFAIDMGKTIIDEECIGRGVALVNYERQVKKYLATEEAATKSAGLQQQMVRLLERNNGRIPVHGAQGFRAMTGERKYGTEMWNKAYIGLVNSGVLGTEKDEIVLLRSWGEKS